MPKTITTIPRNLVDEICSPSQNQAIKLTNTYPTARKGYANVISTRLNAHNQMTSAATCNSMPINTQGLVAMLTMLSHVDVISGPTDRSWDIPFFKMTWAVDDIVILNKIIEILANTESFLWLFWSWIIQFWGNNARKFASSDRLERSATKGKSGKYTIGILKVKPSFYFRSFLYKENPKPRPFSALAFFSDPVVAVHIQQLKTWGGYVPPWSHHRFSINSAALPCY